MSFKDLIKEDVGNIFMNEEEFSDIHLVDGKEMSVQIDDNENIKRKASGNQNMDGIFKKQKMMYVNALNYGSLPAIGRIINLDGKMYTVIDSIDECGIYAITLEANRSGNSRGK